ncbi:EAL domain-containing protein, partial [Staphylococcus aureus]
MKEMGLSEQRRVAINVSVATIQQVDFVQHLQGRLVYFGIPAEWLEIEITEEAVLDNEVSLTNTMKALQSMGVRITMDDFGT